MEEKATKVDDNTFEIDVKKGTTQAEIKAIATKQTEYVSVNGNPKHTSTKHKHKLFIRKQTNTNQNNSNV